jgi:hypothetical protein
MAKEKFLDHKFSASSLVLVDIANGILNEYRAMGYRLSLRQLYYQLVARDFIENSQKSYKRIGDMISNARLAGLVDWEMIEDRGRETVIPTEWTSPAQIVRAAASQFRVDRWDGQKNYCEVMVEKDALSGILEPVCRELHVRFTANKGYSSSSAMYEAGKRLYGVLTDQDRLVNQIHIFYLGDHDPSGIDMTRDITERLFMFSGLVEKINESGMDVEVEDIIHIHRLALNYDQVEQWQPPENPAKQTDSRFEAYEEKFGESSWELDAVEPRTLADLVREGIEDLIDDEQWNAVASKEAQMRNELNGFADEYELKERANQKAETHAKERETKKSKKGKRK